MENAPTFLYHVTYRDRAGAIQVARLRAETHSRAQSYTAARFSVPRRNVISTSRIPSRTI